VIASIITEPKEGEIYVVKSVLGEQKVAKVTVEKDFTIIELIKTEIETLPNPDPNTNTIPEDKTPPVP